MNQGWIKLHRKSFDHWLYKENRPHTRREAWEDILLLCNHSDEKVLIGNELFLIKRGQTIRSLKTWSESFNWTISKVRRFLKLLENDSMIEVKSVQKSTLITVCNYEYYQGGRHTNETQMKRKRNDADTQTTTNKNEENVKNDNNDKEIRLRKIQTEFYQTLIPFSNDYSKELLREFYDYWSEPDESQSKIRKQLEKTWDPKRRLKRWEKNQKIDKNEPVTRYAPNHKKSKYT